MEERSLIIFPLLPPQTPASSAAFTSDGLHAVSAAAGERHVAVWSTLPPKKPKKAQAAIANLALEDPAVSLDTCGVIENEASASETGGEGGFNVAAVSECGEAYVWHCGGGQEAEGGLGSRLLAKIRVGEAPVKG